MKDTLNIILIGPQGSGKGTQAALIKQKWHLSYISGGNIARSLARKNTHEGKVVKDLINKGKLIPDEFLNHEILNVIDKHRGAKLLFDGFPRTITQAKFIYQALAKFNHPMIVVNLQLSDKESILRLEQRLICQSCGAIIYPKEHLHSLKGKFFKIFNRCTRCGGILEKRSDDTPESIKARLKQFHADTEPVIKYLEQMDCLINIDAKPEIEIVFDSISKALAERF